MYIRTKKTPRSQSVSVQLVESFREGGKIKQRVIRHFGTADTKEKLEELKQLATAMKIELTNKKLVQKLPDIKSSFGQLIGTCNEIPDNTLIRAAYLEELQRIILGIHDIYGHIYEKVGFSNLFSRPARHIYSASILREIVLARIAEPKSKRGSVELLNDKFGKTLNLDHVYRMMDKFDDSFYERIQQCTLATTLKLTGEKLRVLFYDATTLYFESFIEDELKQYGYSKDMKFNQSQVLLALFVTEKGLPVGYELFPGSTFEGHTLITVLEKIKQRYQLEEVIFVADRGLFNEENLKNLEEKEFRYIVGARIKNVSKKLKTAILNKDNYKKIKDDGEERTAIFEFGEKRKLIVNYTSARAGKDRHDREKAIQKLYKKLAKSKDPKSLLNNYGYKKYIKIEGNANITINLDKLSSDSQWDGLLGVVTNITDADPDKILVHYRSLWQIEECFRINKHDLKMRPIYHWKPHRVKAHIAISFMAFVCVKYLEYRLSVQSQKISPEVIRQSLMQVQGSVIKDSQSKKCFLLPSKINSHAKEIYRIFRIPIPRKMLAVKM